MHCMDFTFKQQYNSLEKERGKVRARPLMILGGGRRKSRKKNFGGPSPGKKGLPGEKNLKKKACARKKNSRPIFSAAPQIINGRALRDHP